MFHHLPTLKDSKTGSKGNLHREEFHKRGHLLSCIEGRKVAQEAEQI